MIFFAVTRLVKNSHTSEFMTILIYHNETITHAHSPLITAVQVMIFGKTIHSMTMKNKFEKNGKKRENSN